MGHLGENAPGLNESQAPAPMASGRLTSSVLNLCGQTEATKEEGAFLCELPSDSRGRGQNRKENFLKYPPLMRTSDPNLPSDYHITDQETKAQRCKVTYIKSHSEC